MHMLTVKREWTFDDLNDLPDDGNRYEVIDGELFVSPAPALRHQEAVGRLHRIFTARVTRSSRCSKRKPWLMPWPRQDRK